MHLRSKNQTHHYSFEPIIDEKVDFSYDCSRWSRLVPSFSNKYLYSRSQCLYTIDLRLIYYKEVIVHQPSGSIIILMMILRSKAFYELITKIHVLNFQLLKIRIIITINSRDVSLNTYM